MSKEKRTSAGKMMGCIIITIAITIAKAIVIALLFVKLQSCFYYYREFEEECRRFTIPVPGHHSSVLHRKKSRFGVALATNLKFEKTTFSSVHFLPGLSIGSATFRLHVCPSGHHHPLWLRQCTRPEYSGAFQLRACCGSLPNGWVLCLYLLHQRLFPGRLV